MMSKRLETDHYNSEEGGPQFIFRKENASIIGLKNDACQWFKVLDYDHPGYAFKSSRLLSFPGS